MAITESTVAHEAATLPSRVFTASAETSVDTRDVGLILTKSDIKSLKTYELAGLALPTELKDVISYLGYETGAGKGLEAGDFQQTFKLIHAHASLWNPLRTDVMTVNDKLVGFAGAMQIYNEGIKEVLADIRALSLADEHKVETLADIRRIEMQRGEKFPGIDPVDRKDIGAYLNDILKKVAEQEAETRKIKDRLDAFGQQLSDKVKPAISLKIRGILNNTLDVEIQALQTALDNRAVVIDEKSKEYDQLVKEAITSAFGGGGGVVMMIYSSVQAEKARQARDAMREQQEADIRLMATKNTILASLSRVRNDLQNLDFIVLDADIATKNLITVWNGLYTYLSQSIEAVSGMNDALSVRRFRKQFELVAQPWENIEADARKLRNVFAEADREFKQEYGN